MKLSLYHIIYLAVIFCLMCIVGILNFPRFKGYRNKEIYYRLKKDVEIVNPVTNITEGLIKKDTIIKSSLFYDVDDIENNIKYKIILYPHDYFYENIEELKGESDSVKSVYKLK